ncbi:hypothetical protein NQ315_016733 [Exocentrus adspersus]|uniref:Transposase n=1 Tax=Exocentrus adspersus TaxID=1586481 RepID=A0AAV8VCL4_9CUCU|nr:hypothetical protein NQ315_016733 [Exocentrus adspersus]
MPRHLSEAQKVRAIAKLEENWSLSEVARDLSVSKSCIFYVKKRWQEEQRLQRPVRQGVGKVSNNEEDNALVEYIRQNPFQAAVKAREETLFPGSVITARRRLKQSGLKNCAAVSKTFLSNDHKQRRIQFANAFLNRGHEFWNNVIFSDEKTFQSCNSGRLRVYRPRNTRFEERYTLPNASSGRFSVNVWGWISVEGPGVCWQIDGRLTGENYVNILDNVMLPSVQQIFPDNFVFQHQELEDYFDELPLEQERNIVFQQDGAPPHSIGVVTDYLNQRFHVWIGRNAPIKWPPNSPDLTPLDTFLWGTLKDRVNAHSIENIDHLKELIRTEIRSFNEDYSECITAALERLRRIYVKCVQLNGGTVEQFKL